MSDRFTEVCNDMGASVYTTTEEAAQAFRVFVPIKPNKYEKEHCETFTVLFCYALLQNCEMVCTTRSIWMGFARCAFMPAARHCWASSS